MPWTHPQPDGARFSIRPHTAMIFLASRDNFGNGFLSVSSIWCREFLKIGSNQGPPALFQGHVWCSHVQSWVHNTLYTKFWGRTTSRNHRMIWCIGGSERSKISCIPLILCENYQSKTFWNLVHVEWHRIVRKDYWGIENLLGPDPQGPGRRRRQGWVSISVLWLLNIACVAPFTTTLDQDGGPCVNFGLYVFERT